jgi:hypothetical protein
MRHFRRGSGRRWGSSHRFVAAIAIVRLAAGLEAAAERNEHRIDGFASIGAKRRAADRLAFARSALAIASATASAATAPFAARLRRRAFAALRVGAFVPLRGACRVGRSAVAVLGARRTEGIDGRLHRLALGVGSIGAFAALARARVVAVASAAAASVAAPAALALALCVATFSSLWIRQGVDEQRVHSLLVRRSGCTFAGAAREARSATVAAVAPRLAAAVFAARFVAATALATPAAIVARLARFA